MNIRQPEIIVEIRLCRLGLNVGLEQRLNVVRVFLLERLALLVNVQILDSSGKERADVSTKYDFTYSNSSYTYTCNDQDVTVSSVKDNDNLLSINGIEVKISTLKKNFGKYTEADGTVIQITRSPGLKQVYKFTSMGTI